MYMCLLLAASVAARQDLYNTYSNKDMAGSSDHVTSILVQPGPGGPRHVILTDKQQQEYFPHDEPVAGRSVESSFHFSSVDYPRSNEYRAPSPTYGPARPVEVRGRRGQLYHRAKAPAHAKGLSEAIYKYTTFVKHDAKHQAPEGLSAYATRPDEDAYVYENDFDRYEKPRKPFSKLYAKHSYIPLDKRRPSKHEELGGREEFDGNDERFNGLYGHEERFNAFEEEYPEKQSVFDDSNGGRVAPLLARFYKQPLPVIETRLPADSKGLFLQYFPRTEFEERTERSVRYQPSESEWTPINAPSGAVPAKGFEMRAPDLAPKRQLPVPVGAGFRPPEPAVVVGKSKRPPVGGRIQANSEGVVSAVVRVKQ